MDMYRAKILKPALEEAGFTVEIVRSGSVTHGMLKDLVDDLLLINVYILAMMQLCVGIA